MERFNKNKSVNFIDAFMEKRVSKNYLDVINDYFIPKNKSVRFIAGFAAMVCAVGINYYLDHGTKIGTNLNDFEKLIFLILRIFISGAGAIFVGILVGLVSNLLSKIEF